MYFLNVPCVSCSALGHFSDISLMFLPIISEISFVSISISLYLVKIQALGTSKTTDKEKFPTEQWG